MGNEEASEVGQLARARRLETALGHLAAPDQITLCRQVAQQAMYNRDIEAAELYLNYAVTLPSPEGLAQRTDIFCDLANVLGHKGDLSGARLAVERAVDLTRAGWPGDSARILCSLARCHHERGNWDEACTTYHEALRADGAPLSHYYAWLNIAAILGERGEYEQALAIERKVMKHLKCFPDELPSAVALTNMCYQYVLLQDGRAVDTLLPQVEAVLSDPLLGFLRYDLADTLCLYCLQVGQLDRANRYLCELDQLAASTRYESKGDWLQLRKLMFLRATDLDGAALASVLDTVELTGFAPLPRALFSYEIALVAAMLGKRQAARTFWGRAQRGLLKLGFCPGEIARRHNAIEEAGLRRLHKVTVDVGPFVKYLGQSEGTRRVRDVLQRIAKTDVTILLQGESGTGKTTLARLIHAASPRCSREFVRFDCTCTDEGLLEGLLFGHRRGAFTGAIETRQGLVESANGGTMLVDEIADLPMVMQGKLLSVIEEGIYRPIGSHRTLRSSIRFVVATNRDLATEVENGRFRKDLFHRINGISLTLEPLRGRPLDVVLLIQGYLEELVSRHGVVKRLSDEAAWKCGVYSWPGNVRELRKAVERGYWLAEKQVIEWADLGLEEPMEVQGIPTLQEVERQHIERVLSAVGGNKSKAARLLGVKRTTLYSQMEALDLSY